MPIRYARTGRPPVNDMSDLPPPTTAPAGWYPDPGGEGLRYFDGRTWVGEPVASGPVFVERPPHPTLPVGAAWGALAVLTASLLATKLLLDGLVSNDWPLVVYIMIAVIVSYGPSLVWVVHVRRRWCDGRLAGLGWRFRWADLGWGPLTWLVGVITQAVLAALILAIDIPFTSNIDTGGPGSDDREYVVALLVAAVVAAPIVEEMVFRGVVMRGFLSVMRPPVAIAAQGVLFGAAHFDPAYGVGNVGLLVVLSGIGVVLGASAYLWRRLGPVVIAHAILNGIALALALSGVLDDVDNPFEMIAAVLALV